MKHRFLCGCIACVLALAVICATTYSNLDFLRYSVVYQETYRATTYGESSQTVFRHGSTSPVTVVPDLGYEFVGWSDGVTTATRSDENVTDDMFVSPICNIAALDVPVISIKTVDRYAIFSDSDYVDCTVTVINGGEYNMENISAEIRIRGNTSQETDKKSYRLKFNKKRSMFGSDYKAKSWTLIANYFDKSLSRDMLAYTLSSRFENIDFSSSYTYVEVFLNDEYMGVYGFCDQINVGNGRVDINKEISRGGVDDISYLIEVSRQDTDGVEGVDYFCWDERTYQIKSPDLQGVEGAEDYAERIKNSVDECYNAIASGDYKTACEYVDVESFADTYIINELFANNDVYWGSCYFYKDVGGKFTSGPVWDYDIAAGNIYYNYGTMEECDPTLSLVVNEYSNWYAALLKMSEFEDLVKEKLAYYKNAIIETIELANPENENGIYAKYGQAMERNFEKWQIMGQYVWPEPKNVYEIDTVTGQLEFLNNWLTERYYFVCEQYGVEV